MIKGKKVNFELEDSIARKRDKLYDRLRNTVFNKPDFDEKVYSLGIKTAIERGSL